MNYKTLKVIRVILLALAIGFAALFAYRYFSAGEVRYDYFLPVVGLIFFYFISKREIQNKQ
jgi:hypothetical protein